MNSSQSTEYSNLYYINFPPAKDFFQPWFFDSVSGLLSNDDYKDSFNRAVLWSTKEAINPDFHSYLNLDWTEGTITIFWATSIIPLPIHTDEHYQHSGLVLGNGVNFELFNSSVVNFYDPADLIEDPYRGSTLERELTDKEKIIIERYMESPAKTFITDKLPKESYNIKPNDTYIINTMVPHQALADPGRVCVSVRLTHFNNTPWELMVNSFKQSIK